MRIEVQPTATDAEITWTATCLDENHSSGTGATRDAAIEALRQIVLADKKIAEPVPEVVEVNW